MFRFESKRNRTVPDLFAMFLAILVEISGKELQILCCREVMFTALLGASVSQPLKACLLAWLSAQAVVGWCKAGQNLESCAVSQLLLNDGDVWAVPGLALLPEPLRLRRELHLDRIRTESAPDLRQRLGEVPCPGHSCRLGLLDMGCHLPLGVHYDFGLPFQHLQPTSAGSGPLVVLCQHASGGLGLELLIGVGGRLEPLHAGPLAVAGHGRC